MIRVNREMIRVNRGNSLLCLSLCFSRTYVRVSETLWSLIEQSDHSRSKVLRRIPSRKSLNAESDNFDACNSRPGSSTHASRKRDNLAVAAKANNAARDQLMKTPLIRSGLLVFYRESCTRARNKTRRTVSLINEINLMRVALRQESSLRYAWLVSLIIGEMQNKSIFPPGRFHFAKRQ
jgi:hypothetical protein